MYYELRLCTRYAITASYLIMAHGFSATVFSIEHMLISPSCIVRKLVGMSKIGPIWRGSSYFTCTVQ